MKDLAIRVLLDAPVCAFWCFVWHQFHHWWAHSHQAHYIPPPVDPATVFARARQGGVSL